MLREGGCHFAPISRQLNAQWSSFLYHLKEKIILMKVYISFWFVCFLYWRNTSPNTMRKVHKVVKHSDFYTPRGGGAFANVSATQQSIFKNFSLRERGNSSSTYIFAGLYKKLFGWKTAQISMYFEHIDMSCTICLSSTVHVADGGGRSNHSSLYNNHNDNNLIISGCPSGFFLTIDLPVSDNGIPKFSYPTST